MDPERLGTVNSDLMTGRYGGAGASAAWGTVLELYYQDRLEEAFQFALSLGAGDAAYGTQTYRMVEAEWRAREHGLIQEIGDRLLIEFPRDLRAEFVELFSRAAPEEFYTVTELLDLNPAERVMVSLMIPESDAPWTPYRQGFFVDKVPYDKICLPLGLLLNSEAGFREALRHEFGHYANLQLAQGVMTRWLEEAIAMQLGGELDARYVRMIRENEGLWMRADQLGPAFLGDRNSAERQGVWRAYQQAAVIGSFLVSLKGVGSLGELARGFSNNSLLLNLKLKITGQTAEDEALREVYGLSEREVFSQALEWVLRQ